MLKGKFVRIKQFIIKTLLFFRIEVIKNRDGSNCLRRIYSRKPSVQYFIENKNKKDLLVAEIGIWRANNTEHLLKVLPIKRLYAIDSWKPFGSSEHDNKTMNNAELDARKRLSKYKSKVEILKMTSEEAVILIPNEMDFIYIDGDHDYEFVKKDIENYYKKLRVGGILAGDDIQNRKIPNGVFKALSEFAVQNNLNVFIEKNDWWIVKAKLLLK